VIDHPAPVDLSAYVDNEHPSYRMQEIRIHLETCEICRREIELMQQFGDALPLIPAPGLPDDFSERVLCRISPYRSHRRAAIAACLLFVAVTLVAGAALITWGIVEDASVGQRAGSAVSAAITTLLTLVRSMALVVGISWSVLVMLLQSLARLISHQGLAAPIVLLSVAAMLAYLLQRSLQSYHRGRTA